MKIDRLIAIITLLLHEDKITAPELTRRFEVSRRTITRDIEDICRAGIPLVTMQGYGGGISIAKGYKLDTTVLTQSELQTLFAGLKGMSSVTGREQAQYLAEKLHHNDSDDCFIIDLAPFGRPFLTHKIELFKKAIGSRQIVRFNYQSNKGESHRRIEPYHIVFKWSAWYVFGYCLDKSDFRLFKLGRLFSLEPSQETFTPRLIPDDKLCFENYLSQTCAHLKACFAMSEKHRLTDEYGIGCYETAEDGELVFEHDFANYDYMREWVQSFGSRVTILEPLELIADLVSDAQKVLKAYAQT